MELDIVWGLSPDICSLDQWKAWILELCCWIQQLCYWEKQGNWKKKKKKKDGSGSVHLIAKIN